MPHPEFCAPRPWLSRRAGECAFPVDGEGALTRSCCSPAGDCGYCAYHLALMRLPAPPMAEIEAQLAELGLL